MSNVIDIDECREEKELEESQRIAHEILRDCHSIVEDIDYLENTYELGIDGVD